MRHNGFTKIFSDCSPTFLFCRVSKPNGRFSSLCLYNHLTFSYSHSSNNANIAGRQSNIATSNCPCNHFAGGFTYQHIHT